MVDYNNKSVDEYTIDIKHIGNREALRKLFIDTHFKHLLRDTQYSVELRPEIVVNGKKIMLAKKKKSSTPYVINSFIIYTSFLSNAKIKLVKDNKAWKLMETVDPVSLSPVDEDGYAFRQLIEELEEFHKRLVFDDRCEQKTNVLRKKIINYAKSMLTASYNNEPIPKPSTVVNQQHHDKENQCEEVNTKFLKAAEELYKHANNFRIKTANFKKFLVRHQLLKTDNLENNKNTVNKEKQNVAAKRKQQQQQHVAAPIANKRRLTTDMENDIDDNDDDDYNNDDVDDKGQNNYNDVNNTAAIV
ncbi:39k protein [Psilogramma increta granulovirus]|uniref:39k protein n=1 Tax=Psilogramma increta granulovirus TaxID=2953508 RepID=A0A977XV01_9BBAC|nr:39k protein [Psilogramma increta granulovirus]